MCKLAVLRRGVWPQILCIVLLVLGALAKARAWDGPGHEQVADLAFSKLTPKAKEQVRNILAHGEARFRPHGTDEASVRDAFRYAATFPDYIKDATTTIYEEDVLKRNLEFDPSLAGQGGQAARCKRWHYYNTPLRFTGNTPSVPKSNAAFAFPLAVKSLTDLQVDSAGAETRKQQCWWLYWIIHLTGDLHQPLHCCASFQIHAGGDAGGNLFKIKYRKAGEAAPVETNLHAYWDEGINHAANRNLDWWVRLEAKDAEDLTKKRTEDAGIQPAQDAVQDLDATHWIAEGARLADTKGYQETIGGASKDIPEGGVLSETYVKDHIDLCQRRALLGAYRLAAILNAALDK